MVDNVYRAQEARRLSEEPLLVEALELMTEKAQRMLIELPSTAHEDRWLICCELKVIRDFRKHLAFTIQTGKEIARPRAPVA